MCEEYIRVVVETGHEQDRDLFIVHAIKEEEQGPATSLDRLLARVVSRLEPPLQLRTVAGVIACLDHAAATPPSPNSTLADAEEELIAAARQLLHRWAVVVEGAGDHEDDRLSPSPNSLRSAISHIWHGRSPTVIVLRPYQQAAVDAVYDYLRQHDDNPCVVIPTAGGKTPVLSTVCKDAVTVWGGRVLVLAHVKELLQQAADKLQAVCPELQFGVHSAGLKRRDTDEPVIVAGIQSVYKKACELGPFDLIIVDEAHLIPPDGEGMYRQFLADAKIVNPRVRTIGLTATPFRLKSGVICGRDNILNAVCYEVGVRELIRNGYLCPLVTKAGREKADTQQLHVRGGEFVAEEVEQLMDQDALVESACDEIVLYTQDRQAVLIFAAGIQHAEHVQRVLRERHGVECGFVSGKTPAAERDELLARFRRAPAEGLFERAPLKYMVNVNVLTTGFDAPNIDCVALLRPTMSPGLFYQMCGRGFRLYPGKQDCLVLDYGANVFRHGPVDQIRIQDAPSGNNGRGGAAPTKECPKCHSLVSAGYAVCPDCEYVFPAAECEPKHDAEASTEGVLSGQVSENIYPVRDVLYSVHIKQGADESAPKTMRVDYKIGFYRNKSEWVCFEHTGYARWRAEEWWRARSRDPIPTTAEQAVNIANAGGVAAAKSITVRTVAGEKFDRIVDYELGEKPECEGAVVPSQHIDLDDIPF